jgi:CopG antitoxin of type II toxin-antitoxin system
MERSKRSSISKASSYEELGEFWDAHDLSEYWDQTVPVEFEVDIQSELIIQEPCAKMQP